MENDNIDAELLRDLEESAYPIVEQNKALLTRLKCRGFNPAKELDFTANNAGVLIHKFFESVAQFDEGKVPCAALEELFFTTDSLIDELKKCDNAPVCELDAAGVAFREAGMLWKDNHPKPLMEREVYLKKHFDGEKDIKKALKTLHAAYVKKFAAKGKKNKTLSAADVNKEDNKENENRLRIYQEIDRLRKNGYSVLKAIESMSNGSYGSRMRGVSAATWKRYYFERSRRKRLEDAAKEMMKAPNYPIKSPIENETVNETVNSKNETVKSKICETVNINGGSSEGVNNQQELVKNETKSQDNAVGENSENETVKSKIRETVKIKNETVNETVKVSSKVVKRLVKRYPGVNSRRLAEIIGKSRATIMRFISELKNKGEIVFKGSAKSGGYFIA